MLKQNIEYEWYGIEPQKYPIFFDNIFKALDFEIYVGELPTLSGIQPKQPFHLAYDNSRYILIRSNIDDLYARIGEIQPLSPKPIIGVCHTTWTEMKSYKEGHDDWENEYTKISRALGIGRLQIRSVDVLKEGITLDPINDKEKLNGIATKIGLSPFLNTPVDDFPIYGSYEGKRRKLNFTEKIFKKTLINSINRGHFLDTGKLSHYKPTEVLRNPLSLLNELKKLDYIGGKNKIIPTTTGIAYIENFISKTPEEAVLYTISEQSLLDDIRKQFKQMETQLTKKILDSQNDVISKLDKIQFIVEKKEDKRTAIRGKFIIDTPPLSPVKFRIEIPIGELSNEEIDLKIAEIKMNLLNVPFEVKKAFINTISNISEIPKRIREKIISAIKG